MIRLSAFADEISPDLDEQVAVLRAEGIGHLDLRGVWNTNVLDLSDAQVQQIKRTLDASGLAVAAIGSPLGKTPIDAPFEAELRRLDRAIALAHTFETPYIRVFSFYPPEAGGDLTPYAGEVRARLQEMTARAAMAGVTLVHENEKDIYGETIARCLDLLNAVDDPHFGAALDPANFVQCHQTPFPDAYEALRDRLRYVHVKDVDASGRVVAAGEGVSRWPDLLERLRADGYDGVLALEPHLAAGGQFQGFSGPELFRHAARSLKGLLETMGWAYA